MFGARYVDFIEPPQALPETITSPTQSRGPTWEPCDEIAAADGDDVDYDDRYLLDIWDMIDI